MKIKFNNKPTTIPSSSYFKNFEKKKKKHCSIKSGQGPSEIVYLVLKRPLQTQTFWPKF